MCLNDDFDFDGYDDLGDPDDDFQEDMFAEFEPEPDEFELEAESEERITTDPDDPVVAFDFQDAFILGGMIVGQAYEESLDEKEQQEQQIKKKKDED